MAKRKKVDRNNSKVHPTFYRPPEIKDFTDANAEDYDNSLSAFLSEWGIVAGNVDTSSGMATPTQIEIISYVFHKSYTGEDVLDYTIDAQPTDPGAVGFDIRINIVT